MGIWGLPVLLALALSGLAQARTLYVTPPGGYGTNNPPYTSWADAATNIIWAVTAATNNGDEVWITNGTYVLTNTVIVTNGITLLGIGGAPILDGAGGVRCLLLSNANAVVNSLLLTNGNPASGEGAGVLMYRGLMTNCIITGCGRTNTPSSYGGGASLYNNAILANCQVIGNAATNSGGGVEIHGSNVVINCLVAANTSARTSTDGSYPGGGGINVDGAGSVINCIISNNAAGYGGGGIRTGNGGKWTIRNCLIVANNALTQRGGGMVIVSSSVTGVVQNCSVVSNSAASPAGGIYCPQTGVQFLNTISYSNKVAGSASDFYHNNGTIIICTNCCLGNTNDANGNISGTGNFTNNPLFVNAGAGNYRLSPSSPCVNAGLNQDWMTGASDLDGYPRINIFEGNCVDIGAYERSYLNAMPGADGGHVTYTYQIGMYELEVSYYVAFLNAADTNGEITVNAGQVLKAGSSTPYCLTQTADTSAPVIYNSGQPAGQRFSAAAGQSDHPMVFVSWFGAAAYCNWKSDQQGFVKVYNPAGGWTAITTNNGYRLPTEAEWYKAAAWYAATTGFYAYGTSQNTLTNTDANYLFSGDNCETNAVATCPVKSYSRSSPYSLKDASGNVWEWCQDFSDHAGYDDDVDAHAVRGGSWGNFSADVRSVSRSGLKPGFCEHTVGFRIARTSP